MISPIKCSLEALRLLNTKHQCLQVAFGTSIIWIWFIARFRQYFLEQLCTASWKLVLYFIWYNYFTLSQQDLICALLITETLQGVESVNGLGGQHMQVRCWIYFFLAHICIILILMLWCISICELQGCLSKNPSGHDSDIVWSGIAWTCGKQLKHYPAFCRNATTIAVSIHCQLKWERRSWVVLHAWARLICLPDETSLSVLETWLFNFTSSM